MEELSDLESEPGLKSFIPTCPSNASFLGVSFLTCKMGWQALLQRVFVGSVRHARGSTS